MAEHREFEIINDSTAEINLQEYGDFLILLQEAVLYSLEKRDLLTESQRKECVSLLEKQQKKIYRKN